MAGPCRASGSSSTPWEAARSFPADRARLALPRLAELQKKLVTAGGRYPTPMLADQIAFLYNGTLAADQKLGRDVYERYDELSAQLAKIKTELEVLMGSR